METTMIPMAVDPRTKQYVADLKMIDIDRRTISALVSTDSIDRDGDIIVAAGWQLDNYRKNPVVLWAHRYDELPVAKALALEITEHGLLAMMQFAEHELAQDVFDLYVGGFLRAFSVGFRVLPDGFKRRTDGEGWLISKAELLEFSCVPVPANQDALVLAEKALKLCQSVRRAADAARHYLDLPEASQTRGADSDSLDEPAETQTRVDLAAALAGLRTVTAQFNQGV